MANNIKVNLKNVRCAFLHIFKKDTPRFESQAPAYRAVFILDKDDPQLEKLEDAAFECMTEALGSEKAAEKWMNREYAQMSPKECAVCDGDERDEPTPEFENTIYVSAKNSRVQPLIMTDAGEKQKEEGVTIDGFDIEGNEVYSGCMVNASIELWGYSSDKGKGLSAVLKGLKFVADNEAFGGGGGTAASEDDLDDDDEGGKSRKSSAKKSRRNDDDEDDKPRRSRKSRDDNEEDEEEEKPRRSRKSRRDDDEDEEENDRPSRRRRR